MNTEEFHNRLNELYKPPTDQFTLLDVPDIRYMMIDGEGNPDSDAFRHATKWLYAVVHFVRPLVKKKLGKNFVEPPLECLFWADDRQDFVAGNKDKWQWRVMIVFVPGLVTEQEFQQATHKAENKLGTAPASFRLDTLQEGNSVQIMHVGEYSGIQDICTRLYTEYLPAHNLKPHGKYHEIYLNDPSRTAPEKTKVVIRQPVEQ